MVSPRLLPMGDRALLLEVPSLDAVLALHAALAATRPPGVVDLVPAARTVLVRIDPRQLSLVAARAWVAAASSAPADAAAPENPAAASEVVLEIAYDGPDLAETAELLDRTPGELVAEHLAARWSVAFTGFAPGFGYLTSPDWPYDVPRLAVPRTRVPAGSVGLAAGFTGAYPRETPGGWRLIGTTAARLFDPDATTPALLTPGTSVRFRRVAAVAAGPHAAGPGAAAPGAAAAGAAAPGTADPDAAAPGTAEPRTAVAATPGAPSTATPNAASPGSGCGAILVREPGLAATLQDQGRPGAASVGVSGSGALDRGALRTANRLLGNAEGAAGIEVTLGGFRAVATADLWFAVAGAWGPIHLGGRAMDPYEPHRWPAGDELHLDWFDHGARAYLAVRGGFDGPLVLGSRSADTLAGLGSPPLHAGDLVAVGTAAAGAIPATALAPWGAPHDDELALELAPGPRGDWFATSAHAALFESVWTVSNAADRIGVRLEGPPLGRVRDDELPSEGMVPGAIQVPPSGLPTILLADGPVTGGYPVIAVVTDAGLDLLAQARPGTRLRFRHARAA